MPRASPTPSAPCSDYGTQYYFDVGDRARFITFPDLTIDGEHYYGADDDGGDTPALQWLEAAVDGARDAGIGWVVVGDAQELPQHRPLPL